MQPRGDDEASHTHEHQPAEECVQCREQFGSFRFHSVHWPHATENHRCVEKGIYPGEPAGCVVTDGAEPNGTQKEQNRQKEVSPSTAPKSRPRQQTMFMILVHSLSGAYAFLVFLVARPGQHTGQAPSPRYLCPRLHVFHPPRFGFAITFSSADDGPTFALRATAGKRRTIDDGRSTMDDRRWTIDDPYCPTVYAISSAGYSGPLIASTRYCLPLSI